MPQGDDFIPDTTPVDEARGHGKAVNTENVQQFGEGSLAVEFQSVFGQCD